tara:strand:- start:399 stop:758 length:360 start_codon:yes stop_codon:yes gene_type:complete
MSKIKYTTHAIRRSHQRKISEDAIEAALQYGREYNDKKATTFRLDGRSIANAKAQGVNLHAYEGIHVVQGFDGVIVTVFRTRNYKKVRCKPSCKKTHLSRIPKKKKVQRSLKNHFNKIS